MAASLPCTVGARFQRVVSRCRIPQVENLWPRGRPPSAGADSALRAWRSVAGLPDPSPPWGQVFNVSYPGAGFHTLKTCGHGADLRRLVLTRPSGPGGQWRGCRTLRPRGGKFSTCPCLHPPLPTGRGGDRTRTEITLHGILSPVRLPVSPLGRGLRGASPAARMAWRLSRAARSYRRRNRRCKSIGERNRLH